MSVALLLIVVSCAPPTHASTSASTTGRSTSTGSVGTQTIARLWLIAENLAKGNNGAVLRAQAVESTHAKAVQATMGDVVQGEQPVWVVQVEGSRPFVCNSCTRPQGAAAPTGRYLLSVIDNATLRSSDFGIQAKEADLGQLGNVVTLHG